jgi:hypothetical protein
MKKQLQFLAVSFLLLALSLSSTAQTTRRVNGDPNITGVNVYNTIQAAVDAANTDDVILIEAGKNGAHIYIPPTTLEKRLHFRGNGYYLTNPNLSPLPTQKTDIVMGNNSIMTLGLGSSGSTFNNLAIYASIYISSPNITFSSCKINGLLGISSIRDESNNIISRGTNLLIERSILFPTYSISLNGDGFPNVNTVVRNSYIRGMSQNLDGATFLNCNISLLNFQNAQDCVFTNCIFTNSEMGDVTNSSISYCISNLNNLPNTNGNIINADLSQIFLGPNYYIYSNTNYQSEIDSQLSLTSPAKGTGLNGGDMGMFGGQNPYQLSGLPHSPINEFINNSGVGSNTTNISATATFKAN